MRMLCLLALALALTLTLCADGSAQQVPGFETFLLPVARDVTVGAFGSVWLSELHILHELDGGGVFGLNNSATCRISSTEFAACELEPLIPPDRTYSFKFLPSHDPGSEGVLVYVSTRSADRTHFALRVAEQGSSRSAHEILLPGVRVRALTSRPSYFLAVRIESGVRWNIRVYDATLDRPSTYLVQVRDERTGRLIREATLSTRVEQEVLRLGESVFPLRPKFAALSLDPAALDLRGVERVTVVVRSLDDSPFWSFLTVTDNTTQRVTAVLPQ